VTRNIRCHPATVPHTLRGMDLDESRRPLDSARVNDALEAAGWDGPAPLLRSTVTSTGSEAAELLAHGAEALLAVVAESASDPLGIVAPADVRDGVPARPVAVPPAGSALLVSMIVPGVDPDAEPAWLVNLASLAVVEALRTAAKVPAEIGWPDAITVPGAACGGGSAGIRRAGRVSVDTHPTGYVVTVAVFVALGMLELPAGATSVYSDGGRIDRAEILGALLPALGRRIAAWRSGDPSARTAYRDRCQTLGRLVGVDDVEGRVTGIDDRGDLLVEVGAETRTLARVRGQ
jgi:BirA family transcriptional regulator, biotin operon repressor / biotin---[acetyl-CoA-carboxylase] ligase